VNTPAVVIEVCLASLRRHLPGFRGYPPTEAGEKRFAEALQVNVVSVEHLDATLKTFDEFFPTVRQIHDVALNCRPQFEPVPLDQRKEWERQYGKPEIFNLYPPDVMAMHWQAFRDMLYYTEGPGAGPVVFREAKRGYWGEAMVRALDPEWGNHGDTIAFVRNQAREMGWPKIMELNASPVPFPYVNPLDRRKRSSSGMKQIAAPITQADINRVKGVSVAVAEPSPECESEGWDDPDR